jgi:hypothetical protein
VASAATAPAAPQPPARSQSFRGQNSENVGTINVPTQSTLHWSCPGCGGENFIIDNKFEDPGTIEVNSLDQSSGITVMDAGVYHDVTVTGTGAWTFTIKPGTH